MVASLEIDLTCTLPWLGLLKCMHTLSRIGPGEVLVVLLEDQEAVDSLIKIIQRSTNQVLQSKREENCYRVCIRKGQL